MQPRPRPSFPHWQLLLALATLAAAALAPAQTAPAASAADLARYDKNNNGILDPDELEAKRLAEAAAEPQLPASDREVITLSPFQVEADNSGYFGANSLSGTRLNSKIEDLAASITVVTKQQLLDTAAIDLNDIFRNESNTEGIYQFTDFVIDRGNVVDNVAQNPETANRVRGLTAANVARGSFAASGVIPVDTYNVDAVEISRGPNANIFGLGEAAGTINVITSKALMNREITSFSLRADSSDGYRATFDINRPLLQDKLGIRVQGMHENREFERKPSRDKTNRLQASVTYQPFRNTTIRGSYESYHNFNSRPNSSTPRDFITPWRAYGSPVWNPLFGTTGGWRPLDGSTYTAVAAAQEVTLPLGLAPQFTTFWNRPSWRIVDGNVELYSINRMPAPNQHTPANAGGARRLLQIGTLISRGGGIFGSPALPLFSQPGVTDRSLYDWESINLAAANFGRRKADIYQVELEQFFLNTPRNLLAIQTGFYREDIDDYRRTFIGAADGARMELLIDPNEFHLDGTPNPYFLRPYIGGSEPQAFRYPIENETARATLAYQIDLTREENWTRHLGRQRFAVYGEQRDTDRAPRGLRYRDKVVSNNAWVSATNKTTGAHTSIYPMYYLGDNRGFNVDHAPTAPRRSQGDHTLRWFSSRDNAWINENVTIDELYFALGMERTQIRTQGFVWQGFLLDERIIPTVGYRKDRQRSVGGGGAQLDPATATFNTANLFNYGNNWRSVSGRTETRGIVVKPLSWLSVHYNESDSFQPAPVEYNVFRQLLPNPTGEGKDYGFRLNLLEGKLAISFNKYETFEQDKRSTIGVIMTRIRRLETDGGLDVGGDNDLDDFLYGELIQLHPTWTAAQIEAETERLMGFAPGGLAEFQNLGLNDVNNATSKGKEIEIYYNPTRHWTLKANLTQQEAIDSDLSPNAQLYIDQRLPLWTSIRGPATGQLWWETGAGAQNPRTFYESIVLAPLKLAITNQGKPKPQTREWRFNMTTNFKLAGVTDQRWLKNLDIGGSARWEDRGAIGFMAGPADPDGVVRELDGNRPVYDKARWSFDFAAGYNLRLFDNRVRCRLQLNVRDVFESGELRPVAVNPDGTPWNFRIIDPRQFILTATFDL